MQQPQSIPQLDRAVLEDLARRALAEDLGEVGDMTSKRIVRIDQPARAQILAKSTGVLAGIPVANTVFRLVDRGVVIEWKASDGTRLSPGAIVADLAGRARAILAAERVALNFLMLLSGVATLTASFAEKCDRHGVRLLCTRKTIPNLRALQRYAVAVGGGHLHRAGLYDAILIKTNHVKIAGDITRSLQRTKANPNLKAEVEVTSLEELDEAISGGADSVLLDNADLPLMKKAVDVAKGKVFLEISGGVTLENIEEIAKLKPDAISVGEITHSAPSIDLALRIVG